MTTKTADGVLDALDQVHGYEVRSQDLARAIVEYLELTEEVVERLNNADGRARWEVADALSLLLEASK